MVQAFCFRGVPRSSSVTNTIHMSGGLFRSIVYAFLLGRAARVTREPLSVVRVVTPCFGMMLGAMEPRLCVSCKIKQYSRTFKIHRIDTWTVLHHVRKYLRHRLLSPRSMHIASLRGNRFFWHAFGDIAVKIRSRVRVQPSNRWSQAATDPKPALAFDNTGQLTIPHIIGVQQGQAATRQRMLVLV